MMSADQPVETTPEPIFAVLEVGDATPRTPTSDPLPTADDMPRRYLTLIASVADRLLAADHPATMIGDIFALIQAELRLDVFVNYRFNGDTLALEAHAGLSPVQVEALSELALGQAICGCVARDRVPMHATDVQASQDPQTDFIRDIGISAYACTPLIHGDELLGTLSFGRRWSTSFNADELSFLHTICHYVALAKHRLRIEEDLRHAIETRERLLAELNHRVRNSLQLAVGLIALETGSVSVEAERALRRAMDRIQILAAAHRPLYGSPSADRTDLGAMLDGVFEQSTARGQPRHLVPVDQAVIVALLVHELRLSRAPVDSAPTVTLGRADATIEIRISGLSAVPDQNARLVDALVRQLRATLASGPDHAVLHIPGGET